MKKLLLLLPLLSTAAYADVTHKLTNSVQLTTDGAYTVGERGASTYSVSGSNIKVSDSQTINLYVHSFFQPAPWATCES